MGTQLRELADRAIGPVDGGHLRPWMCQGDPATARVLLIGANPATTISVDAIGRDAYLDALVSPGDELRTLYLRLREGKPSPTRTNIEGLVRVLAEAGVSPVLETNVWALPTPDLATLRRGGRTTDPALSVIPALVDSLEPKVLIVHGAAATRGLAALLGRMIDEPSRTDPVRWNAGLPPIVALPSLSPPAANAWLPQARAALQEMAREIARMVVA